MSEAIIDFSEDEISVMLANLDKYTPEEVIEIDKLVDELGDFLFCIGLLSCSGTNGDIE